MTGAANGEYLCTGKNAEGLFFCYKFYIYVSVMVQGFLVHNFWTDLK